MKNVNPLPTRRQFLTKGAALAAAFSTAGLCFARGSEEEEEISPAEDLMREHGVLKRILLIYGEGSRRLRAGEELPVDVIASAAAIIRAFVEDYHEKLEENFLFPRFEKKGMLVELVKVLREQHQAGRRVTERTLSLAVPGTLKEASDRQELSATLESFVRMYNPHEAREDTVLFPALRKIISPHEYAALGEDFEKEEERRFGKDGFEKVVEQVAGLEKRLGIYDLAQFTPRQEVR